MLLAGVIPRGLPGGVRASFRGTSRRLLHPPDVGAEAQEVVDPDLEQRTAVGMVIRSEQFPDKLFAPPKRIDLLADGINPIYDKEMRSELFGQGTLMLRLVIQLSMFLALPLMAVCLYMLPHWRRLVRRYVILFNLLVGPVFSAGSVTSERERQTLDLLLTTILSPWQILCGKLLSGLRISGVLTSFLVWPLLLAWLLPPWTYWAEGRRILGYLAIILVTSLTTTMPGDVLLGALSQDLGQHDDHVSGADVVVCPAAGGPIVRAALLSGHGVGDRRFRDCLHQPFCHGLQPAAFRWSHGRAPRQRAGHLADVPEIRGLLRAARPAADRDHDPHVRVPLARDGVMRETVGGRRGGMPSRRSVGSACPFRRDHAGPRLRRVTGWSIASARFLS